MAAVALLAATPKPADADIDRAMGGNICRCGTYSRIREAVHKAAGTVRPTSSSGASAGQKITTIEAMASDRVGKVVQDAWVKHDVVQCGYCQSGQVMSATALLKTNRKPTDADIDAAMAGNICRCGTYARVRAAIHDAAASLA